MIHIYIFKEVFDKHPLNEKVKACQQGISY